MGARRLKRDLEALLGDYIGQRIRENSFDPKGKGTSTILDDLVVAHYDLAISVAFWWLNKEEGRYVFDRDIFGAANAQYPNHLEREAMILSSFAGMIMNKLPVEEILALYKCKRAASYSNEHSKAAIVYPFTLSYHPFAMLSSYKAVHHSKKHNDKLKRWLSEKANANAPPTRPSSSSSSQSFLSVPFRVPLPKSNYTTLLLSCPLVAIDLIYFCRTAVSTKKKGLRIMKVHKNHFKTKGPS